MHKGLYLFDVTAKQVHEVERPRDLGVVLAQAPVHLAPGAQVHDLSDQLLPDVHLDIWRIFAEAKPWKIIILLQYRASHLQ